MKTLEARIPHLRGRINIYRENFHRGVADELNRETLNSMREALRRSHETRRSYQKVYKISS